MNRDQFWRNLGIGEPVVRHHRQLGSIVYWPIQGQPPRARVGFVEDIELDRDLRYTRMQFRSGFDGPTILPGGLSFFFQGAQDRVVYATHVFNQEAVVATHCIQPHQTGTWKKGSPVRMGMLPLALRVPSLKARHRDETGAEWAAIRGLLQRTGLSSADGAVRTLTDSELVRGKLPTFLSRETLENQRGVVVTINGQVVGLELAPSARQFRYWWTRAGLNESYAIELARLVAAPPMLAAEAGTSLANHLFQAAFAARRIDARIFDVDLGGLTGQAVLMEDELVYASIVGERL